MEGLIHARQSEYYRAIRESSAEGEGTKFIEFMLAIILAALYCPDSVRAPTPQSPKLPELPTQPRVP